MCRGCEVCSVCEGVVRCVVLVVSVSKVCVGDSFSDGMGLIMIVVKSKFKSSGSHINK